MTFQVRHWSLAGICLVVAVFLLSGIGERDLSAEADFDEDFTRLDELEGENFVENAFISEEGPVYEYERRRDHLYLGAGDLHPLDDNHSFSHEDGDHVASVDGELAFVAGEGTEYVVSGGEKISDRYRDVLDVEGVDGRAYFIAETENSTVLVSEQGVLKQWGRFSLKDDLFSYNGNLIYGNEYGEYRFLNGPKLSGTEIENLQEINNRLTWTDQGKVVYGNQTYGPYTDIYGIVPLETGIGYRADDQWYVSGREVENVSGVNKTDLRERYWEKRSPITLGKSYPSRLDSLTERGEYSLSEEEITEINGQKAYIASKLHSRIRYGDRTLKGEDLVQTDQGPVYVRDMNGEEVLYRGDKRLETGLEYETVLDHQEVDGKALALLWTGNSTFIYFNSSVMDRFGASRPPEEVIWPEGEMNRVSSFKVVNGHYMYTVTGKAYDRNASYTVYVDGERWTDVNSSTDLYTYGGRPFIAESPPYDSHRETYEIHTGEGLSRGELPEKIVTVVNTGEGLFLQYRQGENYSTWFKGQKVSETSGEVSGYEVVASGDRICYIVPGEDSKGLYCGGNRVETAEYIWDLALGEEGLAYSYPEDRKTRLVTPWRNRSVGELAEVGVAEIGGEILSYSSDSEFVYGGRKYVTGNYSRRMFEEASDRLMPVFQTNDSTEIYIENP